MPKVKAIHKGECQACGRIQKLPNGLVAAHAYSKYGRFTGTCVGAGKPPIEVGRNVVQGCVTRTQLHIYDMARVCDQLRAEPEFPEAFVEVVTPPNWRTKTEIREWQKKALHEDEYHRVYWVNDLGRKVYVDTTGLDGDPSLRDVVLWLNCKRADALQLDIDQLKEYIVWLENRYQNWEAKDLVPV